MAGSSPSNANSNDTNYAIPPNFPFGGAGSGAALTPWPYSGGANSSSGGLTGGGSGTGGPSMTTMGGIPTPPAGGVLQRSQPDVPAPPTPSGTPTNGGAPSANTSSSGPPNAQANGGVGPAPTQQGTPLSSFARAGLTGAPVGGTSGGPTMMFADGGGVPDPSDMDGDGDDDTTAAGDTDSDASGDQGSNLPPTQDKFGNVLSSNIEDRRGAVDDKGRSLIPTGDGTVYKDENSSATWLNQNGGGSGSDVRPAGVTWMQNALNVVDQAFQSLRKAYKIGPQGQQQSLPQGVSAPPQGDSDTTPSDGSDQSDATNVQAFDDGGDVQGVPEEAETQAPAQDDSDNTGDQTIEVQGDQPQQGGYTPQPMHNLDGSPIQVPKVNIGPLLGNGSGQPGAIEQGANAIAGGLSSAASAAAPYVASGIKSAASGMNSIIGYLTGADAVDPDTHAKAEQDAADQLGADPGSKAAVMGSFANADPQTAIGLLQANRRQFDHYKAFAKVAMDNRHISAAAHAATQMMQNQPDGFDYAFAPGPKGVTVAVTKSDTGAPIASQALTAPQFRGLLNNSVLFDHMYDNAGPKVIMDAAKGQLPGQPSQGQQQGGQSPQAQDTGAGPQGATAAPQGAAAAAGPTSNPAQPSPPAAPNNIDNPANRAANTATRQLGGGMGTSLPTARPGEDNIDPNILKRANSLFPSIGQKAQRAAWIDQAVQRQSTTGIEQTKANTPLQVAQTYSQQRLQTGKDRAQGTVDAAAMRANGQVLSATERGQVQMAVEQLKNSTRDPAAQREAEIASSYLKANPGMDPNELAQNLAGMGINLQQMFNPVSSVRQAATPQPAQRQHTYQGQPYNGPTKTVGGKLIGRGPQGEPIPLD